MTDQVFLTDEEITVRAKQTLALRDLVPLLPLLHRMQREQPFGRRYMWVVPLESSLAVPGHRFHGLPIVAADVPEPIIGIRQATPVEFAGRC